MFFCVCVHFTNAFRFDDADDAGLILEIPQKYKTSFPGVQKPKVCFFLCEFMFVFFAWHFGNILEILTTAQIICMVLNGPL